MNDNANEGVKASPVKEHVTQVEMHEAQHRFNALDAAVKVVGGHSDPTEVTAAAQKFYNFLTGK